MTCYLLLSVLGKEKVGSDDSKIVLLGPVSSTGAGDVSTPGGSVCGSLGGLGTLLVQNKHVSVLAGLGRGAGAHVGNELVALGEVELHGSALSLGHNAGLEARHNVVTVLRPLVVGSRGGIGIGQNQSVGSVRTIGE